MAERRSTDQTDFQAEAPLFERVESVDQFKSEGTSGDAVSGSATDASGRESGRDGVAAKGKKSANFLPLFRRRWVVVGLGLVVIVLTSAAVLLLLAGTRRQPASPPVSPPPASPTAELGDFERRVLKLRQELEAADPARSELPFPPLDMEINLE